MNQTNQMNLKAGRLADGYLAALRTHLAQGPGASLGPARQLGRQARRRGLATLDLTQMHELALVAVLAPGHSSGNGNGTIERAGRFLQQALVPFATAQAPARRRSAARRLPRPTPSPRATELTAARRAYQRETVRRRAAEAALAEKERHYRLLLAQSRRHEEQRRQLAHRILLAQEEERKHISRELHDEISQILTVVNVGLAALKLEATANTGNLRRKIVSTQRLVGRSVDAVHRFARELRPAMLDDLGLVPALLSFMKEHAKRTGLRIRFATVKAEQIERLSSLKRTVLYRVAQEALTNVAKHAQASLVTVSLRLQPGAIAMEIGDDGRSFDVDRTLGGSRCRRLGILGMRERVEMVGGTFAIDSVRGRGTTVRVRIPFRNGTQEHPCR